GDRRATDRPPDLTEPGGRPGRAEAPSPGGSEPHGPDRPRGPGPAPLRAADQQRRRPGAGPRQVRHKQALRPCPDPTQGPPGHDAGRLAGALTMATNDASSSPDAERDPIEVMAESFLERFRRGERPSIDEFASKFPELADEIRELLPALVQLERDVSAAGTATGLLRAGPPAATLRGAPRQLGDYTILREIARGGMGVVYEAVQQSLGRHVA